MLAELPKPVKECRISQCGITQDEPQSLQQVHDPLGVRAGQPTGHRRVHDVQSHADGNGLTVLHPEARKLLELVR